MGKYTALEMGSYFQRVGNKDLFANGMTLSQLANAMSEYPYSDVDVGSLSKIINGQRKLLAWQLEAFCHVLNISDLGRRRLERAMAQDRCGDVGLESYVLFDPAVVTFLTKDIERIKQARMDGSLGNALSLLSDIFVLQRELMPHESDSPPSLCILSLLEEERELLMEDIAESGWAFRLPPLPIGKSLEEIDALNTSSSDINLAFVNQVARTAAPLSERERLIWVQRYEHGRSEKDIAANLSLEVATVHALLLSARRIVMDTINENEQG